MRRLSTVLTTLAAALALTLAGAGAATGQEQYPPGAPSVGVDSPTVQPGGTLTVTLSGFQPGSLATITFPGADPITLPVNAQGQLVIPVPIPDGAPPGTYAFQVTGTGADGEPASVTTEFTIAADPTDPTTPTTAPPTTAPPTTDPGAPTPTTVDDDDAAAAPGATTTTMARAGAAGTLPRTGADTTTTLGQVALVMVVLGTAMVGLVWRRRRTAVPAQVDV